MGGVQLELAFTIVPFTKEHCWYCFPENLWAFPPLWSRNRTWCQLRFQSFQSPVFLKENTLWPTSRWAWQAHLLCRTLENKANCLCCWPLMADAISLVCICNGALELVHFYHFFVIAALVQYLVRGSQPPECEERCWSKLPYEFGPICRDSKHTLILRLCYWSCFDWQKHLPLYFRWISSCT